MADTWQTIEQAAVSLGLSVRTINRHISAGKLKSRLSDGRREVLVTLPDTPFANAGVLTDDVPELSAAAGGASEPIEMPLGAGEPGPSASMPAAPHVTTSGIDADTVLALADNAASKAEMAVTAYQTLARVADAQVRQARRGARVAWAAAVLMAVGITGAVGWTTHRLTRTTVELDQMQRNIAAADEVNRSLSARRENELVAHDAEQKSLRAEHQTIENALRTELSSAKAETAHAEGQLAAYKEQATAALAQVAAHRTSDTLPRKAESSVSTTRPTTAPSSDTQASTSDHEEEP